MLYVQKTPEMPAGCPFLNEDFEVRINGEKYDVRGCRVSAMPFNTLWPGHQRPLDQTELSSYISFESDVPVDFRVTPAIPFTTAVIRPLSSGLTPECRNGVLTFRVEKPGFYVLELDDMNHALHIFFNAPDDFPEKDQATYFFGPGIHFANPIRLKDNDTVYIDRDAVVYGAFQGKQVKNVRIFGYGVIDGSSCERIFRADYLHLQNGNVSFYDSADIKVNGPVLMNSPTWSASFFHCRNVQVENLKLVGQWRYNSDGIDFTNCQNCSVKHCFVRAFDDVLVVKGIPNYQDSSCSDISFEGCVLWCDWGRTCEIGAETWGTEICRIRFADCDLIHNSAVAMDIQAVGPAPVHDIAFENLRVEYQTCNAEPIYQRSQDMKYVHVHNTMNLLAVVNPQWDENEPHARIADITVRNIQVTVEEGAKMPKLFFKAFSGQENPNYIAENDTENPFWRRRKKYPPLEPFGRITLEDITINGRPLTSVEELPLIANSAGLRNVIVKASNP